MDLTQQSRALTRLLMKQLESLPRPVKAAIGFLPGGGIVLEAADTHKWAVINLAHHYATTGKLSPAARQALAAYDHAHAAEFRAYDKLVRLLGQEL